MEPLTSSQQSLYDFLRNYLRAHGYPPSQREMSDGLQLKSRNSIRRQLAVLERKGYISVMPEQNRGIRLLNQQLTARLPLVGTVAAGIPIEAIENIERYVEFDPSLMAPEPDYLLTVNGDSMINAGILEGDLVGVKQTTDVKHGQIVVARCENEATIKRLHVGGDGIRLIAENPAYQDLNVEHDGWAIEGLYCGLIRPSGSS